MQMRQGWIVVLLLGMLGLPVTHAALATTHSKVVQESNDAQDPLESFNRPMFYFNEKLDQYLMKPIAQLYNAILPTPIHDGIHNVFSNIGEIRNIGNDLLQLRFYQMANDAWRFGVNTTVGILGIFDIGTRIHLNHAKNDFGLTLARWGYRQSSYLVLPFFGSMTVRDAIGMPVDYYAFSIYPHIDNWKTRDSIYALNVVDIRANLLQYENLVEEIAVDRYAFARNAYLQHRINRIDNQDVSEPHDEKPVATVR